MAFGASANVTVPPATLVPPELLDDDDDELELLVPLLPQAASSRAVAAELAIIVDMRFLFETIAV